ncbi:MAG: N-acetyltransferase [Burkholderiales bacterium]|nr:N-acetyltransferase [Burkholderiales bacterium]
MSTIRAAIEADAPGICAIYKGYVLDTTVTFENATVGAAEMAGRVREVTAGYPWLVACSERGILGYAYATRWRSRGAYDRTVESTIYLRADAIGSGTALPLYGALLAALRERSFHAVVGCIALPNPASVAFHEKCGFRKVAHFAEVGRKFGRWVDVGFWELLLDPADRPGS